MKQDYKIAVIGLGYVGLPLFIEFSKKFEHVIGFDVNTELVNDLKKGIDKTDELSNDDIDLLLNFDISNNPSSISECNFFIVTVPTPVNSSNQPDLSYIENASYLVGSFLKNSDIVVYESTVYPGVSEEVCAPILEKESGLILNKDFSIGYSPERINPGDKSKKLIDILKITSASNEKALEEVDYVYKSIITAGTYKASSIKVAEAAKVIENTQRDLNIALINELAIIFDHLDIDTFDVLSAANTKWNFLDFRPGLVGGHCIGVDPYYLTYKAQEIGYIPEVILSGRRINDNMYKHIASKLIKKLISNSKDLNHSKVLILGFTFKENCPDIRNTKIFDLYNELKSYSLDVDVYDPVCSCDEVYTKYNVRLLNEIDKSSYDSIIFAVPHKEFLDKPIESYIKILNQDGFLLDLKGALEKSKYVIRL